MSENSPGPDLPGRPDHEVSRIGSTSSILVFLTWQAGFPSGTGRGFQDPVPYSSRPGGRRPALTWLRSRLVFTISRFRPWERFPF